MESKALPFIGGIVGFGVWLAMLESDKMSGILFRKNAEGQKVFTPWNIVSFAIAPFKYTYFWTTELIYHNWIVVTSLGVLAGYYVSKAL